MKRQVWNRCSHASERMGKQWKFFGGVFFLLFHFKDTYLFVAVLPKRGLVMCWGFQGGWNCCRLKYAFVPAVPDPFLSQGLEKRATFDSHLSVTCRHWSLSSAFRKVCGFISNCCLWGSVALSLLCIFQGQSGKAAALLKPPTQRDRGITSCWIRVWEKQHLSLQCKKCWPTNATAAHTLTVTPLPPATETFGSSTIYFDVKLHL